MPDDEISRRMRDDWNARAREDAGYFVAFGRRYSDDAQFFATATEVINRLEWVLSRVPVAERGAWRALEVGCGPGRLMRPMSRHFVEIHGVDVSDEMIVLAKEKLRDIPTARTYVTGGSTLPMFEDESFEFVYSYAVFQHIPAREVIVSYLREIHRVMKTDGPRGVAFQRTDQSSGAHRYLGRRALLLRRSAGIRRPERFSSAGA